MSTKKPTEPGPPSGELANELESFRRQWKEDLQSQRHPAPNSPIEPSASSSKAGNQQSADSGNQKFPNAHKRRHSLHTRDGVPQKPLVQKVQHDVDDFRSLDLNAKSAASLGVGEKTASEKPLTTALDYYEAAAEKEMDGKLDESVRLYRKAFKLDPDVQTRYKEKHYPRESKKATSGKTKKADSVEKTPEQTVLLPTEGLIKTFASIPITGDDKIDLASLKGKESYKKAPSCPISKIPREILIQVFSRLAESDLTSFVRSTTTCKAICFLIYTERQIWKNLCKNVYENLVWGPSWACSITGQPSLDGDMNSLESGLAALDLIIPEESEELEVSEDDQNEKLELPKRPLDEIEVVKYNSSYRLMYIERPRLRYNGIYISTCTYHRPGHQVTSTLTLSTTPFHLVTYYRYLRFFPSGFVLHLLTPVEPSEVVHALTLENYQHIASASSQASLPASLNNVKHVLPGRWRVFFNPQTYPSPNSTDEVGGRIQIESKGSDHSGRYINTLDLTLKMRPKGVGGRRGYGDRLAWNSYTSLNTLTQDKGVYSLRNDKPFYFSRVKAFERELEEGGISGGV